MCVCADTDFEVETKRKIFFLKASFFLDVCLKKKRPSAQLLVHFSMQKWSPVAAMALCSHEDFRIYFFFSRPRQDVQQPRRHLYVDPKTKVISQDSNLQIKRLPVRTSWRHTRAQPKRKFFITYPDLLTQYGFDLLSARSTSYEGKNGWGNWVMMSCKINY